MKLKLKRREAKFLKGFTKKGNKNARVFRRATILLLLDKGETGDSIAEKLNVNRDTVYNVKRRYLHEGLNGALQDKSRPGQPLKYKTKHRAEIIAYACTRPPEGRKRWSIRLLTEELQKKKGFTTINRETIRLVLKKTTPNLG